MAPGGPNGGNDVDWESFTKTPMWLLVFFNNMICGCAGFAIVLPTLWPLLREMGASTRFMALVVAMYSVGEGIGGIAVGHLCERYPDKPKAILLGGMVAGCVAAFFYSIARMFDGSVGQMIVLVARLVQGLDNGGRQTIEQSFLSSVVPPKYLTLVSSRLSSFAITGIMLGPTLGGPLQALDLEVPGVALHIDGNNAPGFLLCFLCMVNIAMTAQFFNPDNLAKATTLDNGKESSRQGADGLQGVAPPSRLGLNTCYAVFFMIFLSMAVLETITPVVAQELWGWGPCLDPGACPFAVQQMYVNALLSVGGLLALAMSLLMSSSLGTKVHGREVPCIVFGLLVPVLTSLNNVDWFGDLPAWRFVLSYCLGAFFGGFVRGPCYSLFSQIIGPHPKSAYMGASFFCGALPRIFGPFAFVVLLDAPTACRSANFPFVYEGPIPRTWLLYGSVAALNAATLALVLWARERLTPHPALLAASAEGPRKPLLAGVSGHEKDGLPPAPPWLPTTPTGRLHGEDLDAVRAVLSNISPKSLPRSWSRSNPGTPMAGASVGQL